MTATAVVTGANQGLGLAIVRRLARKLGTEANVYLTGRDGTTLVLKQSDKLEVLATNKLNDPVDASPAVVGKQLFLRGEKFLYCIEEE